MWRLEVRDADGEIETFHVTDDHPWYVEGEGWVETQHLRSGQRIETADDRGLTILDIARTDRVERTYNPEVEGWHTFLVGEDGAVVHNCRLPFTINLKIFRNMRQRGWSSSDIQRALNNPTRTVATRDTRHLPGGGRMNDPATAYYSPNGGYVVRNDVTGQIVQVSGRNPGWRAPWD